MQTSARFSKPIDAARPRGAHRLEAFSPKLDRRLSLFSRASFELWLGLEADPAVQTLCERPGFIQCDQKRRLAEFWVRYAEREELLLLEASEAADADMTEPGSAAPLVDAQLAVRIIQPAERAAARIWISNWERMLPCVIANRKLLSESLLEAVVGFVGDATPLSSIERALAEGDPMIVRAAVFTLLHAGRLRAPCLHTEALSLLTPFLPVAHRP